MTAKSEMKVGTDGQYMFNPRAGNGEMILTSEMYPPPSPRETGIRSVIENAAVARVVEVF